MRGNSLPVGPNIVRRLSDVAISHAKCTGKEGKNKQSGNPKQIRGQAKHFDIVCAVWTNTNTCIAGISIQMTQLPGKWPGQDPP